MRGWIDCRGKVCVVTLSILFIQVRSQVMSKFNAHTRTHTLLHAVEKCVCVYVISAKSHTGWMLAWLGCIKVNSDISIWPPE